MNKLNKQGTNILKTFFSNTGRRISLFVSLTLMLLLSGALVSSIFLSDSTLNKLAQSNYFQNKMMQVLEENNIFSNGGRVLNVSSIGKSFKKIRKRLLEILKEIDWKHGFFRKDIGWKVIK